jgi:hypothetical protein
MTRTPGDYQINEISIKSLDGTVVDVRYLMEELNIYENLFTNTLSGNIILNDSLNLPANHPIVGHETLAINIEFPEINHKLELYFWIYKQSGTTLDDEGSQTYALHFTTYEFKEDRQQKVNQSWSFQFPDQIIRNIFKTHFPLSTKTITTEEPLYKQNLVVPSWSPFKTINWLTTRSITDKQSPGRGIAANFVFYETQNGFFFQSVAALLKQDVGLHPFTGNPMQYVYHPGSYRPTTQPNFEEDFRAVKNFYFEDTFDVVKNLALGFYANKLTTYDIITKEVEEHEFDLAADWEKQLHLESPKKVDGQKSSIPASLTKDGYYQSYNQMEMLFPKHHNLFGDNDAINESSEKHPDQWLQQRVSQLQALSHIKLNIKVPGDLTRTVGEIVEVMLPSPEPQGQDMNYDKFRKGRYLITGIRHQFLKTDYNTHLQLQKDSLAEALPVEGK